VTLADLPALLERAGATGARVRSTVFVTDAEQAPPALTRAVYRVVQESLTNALRHAPGEDVTVEVHAAPGQGACVRVTNRLSAAPPAGLPAGPPAGLPAGLPSAPGAPDGGGGAGLVGMRERAERLGGRCEAGPVGDRFVVDAHLPWDAVSVQA
jgi:signal transduction histidine kinase